MQMAPEKRVVFSAQDDAYLNELYRRYGPVWELISRLMHKPARKIRERYVNFLSPHATRAEWSEEEDNLLLEKVVALGPVWSRLTPFFPHRNAKQLKNRYSLLQYYLLHESELLRMNKRILRKGTLYSWINDPSDPPMTGTGTNATTRAFVRHTANIPGKVRKSIAAGDGRTAYGEFRNVIAAGQKPDAGHIRSNQNGGFGDQTATVYAQNPQVNRGNYIDGAPTFDLWRGLEELEHSLHNAGIVSYNSVMLYDQGE